MPAANVTLVAALTRAEPVAASTELRRVELSDVPLLGQLYFASYPTGVVGDDVEAATADIAACFDGEYGALNRAASLAAVSHDQLVGAVLVVDDPPWEDTPQGPFIV